MRSDVGISCLVLLLGSLGQGAPVLGQATGPTLAVDVSNDRHAISREIYGIANYGLDATYAKQIQVGNIRWGGDGTTRYNWQVDSSNAGFDWYFMGGNGSTNPTPSASVDLMIQTYKPADALITIPIIPYVNKSAAWNCSFPVSIYGAQQSVNPYVHPNGDNCGNSIASNGTQLLDNNIYANHIDNSTGLQKGWLQHLVGTFGPASQGGVAFYQLDNEPDGWSNTHRDVLPNGADYPTITQLGEQYAAAIKQVDPTAMVLGPSDFTLGGWVGDTTKQNGLLAGQYYLQQMAAYDQQNGGRILDYFDEHYYFDVSSPSAQLASTRTLWDPNYNGGTWVEQYVFDGPMQLITRFKSWVAQYYPGTKISLSEYSIDSGNKSIVDALAEMDVLGIFGREQLDFANMWSPPAPTDPIAYSFRMYRNYDGSGGQYGDTWVNATSSNQSQLSVYAAQRSSDNVVTVLVLNKTTAAISTNLALTGVTLPSAAAVYSYTAANLQQIVSAIAASINNGAIGYTFPGYSATMFAFTPAATPPASTTTNLTATPTQASSGQSVILTATVVGSGSLIGTISFRDGSTVIGTAPISSGTASLNTAILSTGSHAITAIYSGDSNDATSTSSPVTVTVTPPIAASTLTSLSVSPTQATVGQAITLTARVTGSASPTGIMTFLDGGVAIGSASLAAGKASLSTTTLSIGSHAITSAYAGDTNNAVSTSSLVTVTVTQPAPANTATILTASQTQVTAGQNIILTAIVTGTGSPIGMVTFSDGSVSIGSASLSGGKAIFSTTLTSIGQHPLTATYNGDSNDAASNSISVTVTVSAAAPIPAATTTILTASATQLTTQQSLFLTAAVSSTGSTPTGKVTISDSGTVLGTVQLINGAATFTDSTLSVGNDSIVATYSGDAGDMPSTSAPISISVINAYPVTPPSPQDFSLQLTQVALTLAPGTSGQIGLIVTPQNGFNQQVTLSCTGLPSSATCSFSPATLNASGVTTGNMIISTNVTAAALKAFLLPLPTALLLLLRRRKKSLAFGAISLTLLIAGCGAGINSQPTETGSNAGTTPQTFTIQVIAAAASGQTHVQQLVLTFQ